MSRSTVVAGSAIIGNPTAGVPHVTALICLSYDDALPVHREVVAPLLSQHGLTGTFYVPAARDDLHEHLTSWRAVAAAGHELGNHTCWHPCRGRPGWLPRPYRLEDYDRQRIRDELILANRVLHLVDGRMQRSYAATCGDTACGQTGDDSFVDILRELFPAIRVGLCDQPLLGPHFSLTCFHADRRSAADVIAVAEQMRDSQYAWLVVLMHGVGAGTHNSCIDAGEHSLLVEWIAAQRDWLDGVSVIEAVSRRGRLSPT